MRILPRYRLSTEGRARTDWRETWSEMMQDIVELGLASWDGAAQEHCLASTCHVEVGYLEMDD